jgi:hypothetical protein
MNGDPDIKARNRFFAIGMMRLSGAALVVFGLVVALGRVASIPIEAGYVLVVAGLLDFAVIPVFLARRWRTPPGA